MKKSIHLFLFPISATLLLALSPAHCASQTFSFQTFDVPGAQTTSAVSINDESAVVGWHQYLKNDRVVAGGFLRYPNGTFHLYSYPSAEGSGGAELTAINDGYEVAGYYANENSYTEAFFKSPQDDPDSVLVGFSDLSGDSSNAPNYNAFL